VTMLTLATMAAEIVGGLWSGSMALLADGIHMTGHALALGLAAVAYALARRHAHDRRLSLGSGKIGDLAAYTSALLLGVTTVWLVAESVHRLLSPRPIHLTEALVVAVVGLVVNLLSAWLLAGGEDSQHHHHDHPQEHLHDHHHGHDHAVRRDSNLRAALVHVWADACTSVAAIIGLTAARLKGWQWLDPAIALLACGVILHWTVGLLRQTTAVLLDREGPRELRRRIQERIESIADSRVVDLHLWSVGQNTWTLVATVVTHLSVPPEQYKTRLADLRMLHHPVIEVHYCQACEGENR